MAPMGNFAWRPPAHSAHAPHGSCPTGSSTCSVSGRVHAGASRLLGTPCTRTVLNKEFSALAHVCSAAAPISALPCGAQYMKRGPRPALHVTAEGCALRQPNCLLIYWHSALTATVPGLWVRGLLDTYWGLLACFSGASWSQF